MQTKRSEFPRLSRSIRAFTDLDLNRNFSRPNEKIYLRLWRFHQLNGRVCWRDFEDYISYYASDVVKKISKHMSSLWSLTAELVGPDEPSDLIQDAAMFNLRLFLNVKLVAMSDVIQMRTIFGKVPLQTIKKIAAVVSDLTDLLDKDCKYHIEMSIRTVKASCGGNVWWGRDITCSLPTCEDTNIILKNLCPNLADISVKANTFSMQYKEKKHKLLDEGLHDRQWLENQFFPDYVPNIIQILSLGKSDEQLQNELFELLGFDQFDKIQLLLQNRCEIVRRNNMQEKKDRLMKFSKQEKLTKVTGPNIAGSMVVKSEQERQLLKQERKDGKLLNRIMKKMTITDENTDDDGQSVDIKDLRFKNQQRLLNMAESTASNQNLHRLKKKIDQKKKLA